MDDVRVRRRVSASFQIFTLTTAGGKCPRYKGNFSGLGNVRENMSEGGTSLHSSVYVGLSLSVTQRDTNKYIPLTSTWPHLRCDVGLEEGEHRENCPCLAVLCTIIMVHKDTSSSCRLVNCIGLRSCLV